MVDAYNILSKKVVTNFHFDLERYRSVTLLIRCTSLMVDSVIIPFTKTSTPVIASFVPFFVESLTEFTIMFSH